jgi:S-adenosylmethionine:tRNA ribosyltransferase-isomerase
MDVRDFDFTLPPELIAQEPLADRASARLLVVNRAAAALAHASVSALPDYLQAGDLVVVNNTRVFPARLLGRRVPSGGGVECLLVQRTAPPERDGPEADGAPATLQYWETLVHPGQKLRPGSRVVFEGIHTIHGEILERRFFGRRVVRLWTDDGATIVEAVDAIGHVPLPPYIKRNDRVEDRERYQTVFADARGSIAAPTAGLHFTPPLVDALAGRGVEVVAITLHVGYGTFQPVRVDRVEDHRLDAERFEISDASAVAIERARAEGRRIIAVGTTTTRTLEAVARANGSAIVPGRGSTDLFIYPGFRFQVIAGLLTNFHLPKSSLLMLVSAFAGRELVRTAYDAAIAARYRFYSYGDAMLVL